MANYVKTEVVSLKKHPEIDEKWVQGKIADDPTILGLGELILKDTERPQPGGGRLDLLCYDPEINRRYEIELQLGNSDESHIIRTLEYWDYQRKKFPQYDHCAVLVAEDITSRFLNVISLFNGIIPFIAIQVKAVKVGEDYSLFFTTVIDELRIGTEEEDEQTVTDRKYWESKGTTKSVQLADRVLELISEVAPGYELKYNKHYIGLSREGLAQNFVSFVPRKKAMLIYFKHKQSESFDELLNDSDFDVLAYDRQWDQYRLRLTGAELESNRDELLQMIKWAYEAYTS